MFHLAKSLANYAEINNILYGVHMLRDQGNHIGTMLNEHLMTKHQFYTL
jgi:hypothetical protein